MRELIYKDEAYKAIDNCIRDGWDRISPSEAKMNIHHLVSDANDADRPQGDEFKNFDRESLILLIEAQKERIGELLADRPQGEWVKEDRGGIEYTGVCSECGYATFWSDIQDYNFCPHCGAKMKGADDEASD